MGRLSWSQRISHFDRPLKHRDQYGLGLKGTMRKAEVKRRRGIPSRNFGSDTLSLVFALIDAKVENNKNPSPAAAEQVRALTEQRSHALLRGRMLEKKRAAKRTVAFRKVTAATSTIYLWKRRQDWLKKYEDTLVGQD